jgi:hypothetical protein
VGKKRPAGKRVENIEVTKNKELRRAKRAKHAGAKNEKKDKVIEKSKSAKKNETKPDQKVAKIE